MEHEIIYSLTTNFESFSRRTKDSLEFWFARDLQHLLGYSKWENFQNVISKAKTACEISGHEINDHFPDIRKTIAMPKNAEKEIDDIMLTRYACYLIAQNGDSSKTETCFRRRQCLQIKGYIVLFYITFASKLGLFNNFGLSPD